MSDKLYMNKDEVAIYRDSELYSITRVNADEWEFIENLKILFPESDIEILGFSKIGKEVPRRIK
jgi:hypothetical protein